MISRASCPGLRMIRFWGFWAGEVGGEGAVSGTKEKKKPQLQGSTAKSANQTNVDLGEQGETCRVCSKCGLGTGPEIAFCARNIMCEGHPQTIVPPLKYSQALSRLSRQTLVVLTNGGIWAFTLHTLPSPSPRRFKRRARPRAFCSARRFIFYQAWLRATSPPTPSLKLTQTLPQPLPKP